MKKKASKSISKSKVVQKVTKKVMKKVVQAEPIIEIRYGTNDDPKACWSHIQVQKYLRQAERY